MFRFWYHHWSEDHWCLCSLPFIMWLKVVEKKLKDKICCAQTLDFLCPPPNSNCSRVPEFFQHVWGQNSKGKKNIFEGRNVFLPVFPFEQVVNYFPSPPPSGFSSKIFHEIPEIPRLVQRMRGRLWSSTMNHQSTRQTLMSDGKPPLESLSAVCEIDFSHHVTAFSRFINQPGWWTWAHVELCVVWWCHPTADIQSRYSDMS